MTDKKQLKDEELDKVNGGFDDESVLNSLMPGDKVTVRFHFASMIGPGHCEYRNGRIESKDPDDSRAFLVWIDGIGFHKPKSIFWWDIEKAE